MAAKAKMSTVTRLKVEPLIEVVRCGGMGEHAEAKVRPRERKRKVETWEVGKEVTSPSVGYSVCIITIQNDSLFTRKMMKI